MHGARLLSTAASGSEWPVMRPAGSCSYWGSGGSQLTVGPPAAPAQVGLMSWGQRFDVEHYQAYDIGGPLLLHAHHLSSLAGGNLG